MSYNRKCIFRALSLAVLFLLAVFTFSAHVSAASLPAEVSLAPVLSFSAAEDSIQSDFAGVFPSPNTAFEGTAAYAVMLIAYAAVCIALICRKKKEK